MINLIWMLLIGVSIITALACGKAQLVSETIFSSAGRAFELAIGLAGLIAFWSGILKIAESSGITEKIARMFYPVLRRLFPGLKHQSKALGLIAMTMTANMLGLGNVATPLGLETMKELQRLNPQPERASKEICTFLALVLGGLSLIPSTLIAIRAQAGSKNPALVMGPILIVTFIGTVVALIFNYIAQHILIWRCQKEKKHV